MEMTPQERIVWNFLRDGELRALNWRRQGALGDYIIDFVSHPARLIVEIDGSQHGETKRADYDARRTAWLNAHTFHAAAAKTSALARMQRWRMENIQVKRANTHLPLDGGGGREAAGGGVRTNDEGRASGGMNGKVRGPHPLSHASRDSSPIEGERK